METYCLLDTDGDWWVSEDWDGHTSLFLLDDWLNGNREPYSVESIDAIYGIVDDGITREVDPYGPPPVDTGIVESFVALNGGEVRTVSSTGGEKGVKPQRYDLLPVPGLAAIAECFAFGAEKYADHNWRKRYEWGKSYAALMRHMTAFWNGETYDPESGLPHLSHAGFHILVLLTWLIEDGEASEFDDRYRRV
jgi:hypothetical protein